MGRVFISYSTTDQAVAKQVAQALRDGGVSVWMAPDSIAPGQVYSDAIVAGLRDAEALAVLVSNASNASKHVAREVGLADSQGKPIIPIRIEQVNPSDALVYYLSLPQWVEWHSQGAAALRPLIATLDAHFAPPPVPAPPATAPHVSPPAAHPSATAAQGFGIIQIQRGGSAVAMARKFAILLDGQKVAEVGNNGTVEVRAPAGARTVAARVDFMKSDPFPVDVQAGQTAVLHLSMPEKMTDILSPSKYFRWERGS